MPIVEFANGKRVEFSTTPTDKDIEEAARALGITNTNDNSVQKPVGMFQGLVQDVAKPFLKVGATIAQGAAGLIAGDRAMQNAREQGVDFGYYGTVKPFGSDAATALQSGDISFGKAATRAGLETGGSLLEIASYGLAPLKAIATFGVSKGLQSASKGESASKVATEVGLGTAGGLLGYGAMNIAGRLLSNWGARALQNQAFKKATDFMRSKIDNIQNMVSPEFAGQVGAGEEKYLLSKSAKRVYNVAKKEYDLAFENMKNTAIDAMVPEVNNPELTMRRFQNSLSEQMGSMFRKSAAIYDDVKADMTLIESLPMSLAKAKTLPPSFSDLINVLSKPHTLKQILDLNAEFLEQSSLYDNETNAMFRELASKIFSDAKNALKKSNPELLDSWNMAYQEWLKASDIYNSPVMRGLKSVGEVDTLRDKIISNTLSEPERKVVTAALQNEEKKGGGFSSLLIESVLRKAKSSTPSEGAKAVDSLLDGWDFLLNEEQSLFLDDLSSFLKEDFNKVAGSMFGDVASVAEKKSALDVAEMVNKGDFEGIANNFFKIAETGNLKQALKHMTPGEKRVVGLSILRDMFEESMPLIEKNADGTYNAEKIMNVVNKALKDVDKIGGVNKSGIVGDIFNEEQIAGFEQMKSLVKDLENVKQVPKNLLNRLYHAVLGLYSAHTGRIGATTYQLGKVIGPSRKEYYESISRLVNEGLKTNSVYTIGELLKAISQMTVPVVGQITTE